MKFNPKMGFWRAKHGLSKHGIKTKIGLHFGGELKNGWEKEKIRGRERRRREEEKEGDQAKVWNFGFLYGN